MTVNGETYVTKDDLLSRIIPGWTNSGLRSFMSRHGIKSVEAKGAERDYLQETLGNKTGRKFLIRVGDVETILKLRHGVKPEQQRETSVVKPEQQRETSNTVKIQETDINAELTSLKAFFRQCLEDNENIFKPSETAAGMETLPPSEQRKMNVSLANHKLAIRPAQHATAQLGSDCSADVW